MIRPNTRNVITTFWRRHIDGLVAHVNRLCAPSHVSEVKYVRMSLIGASTFSKSPCAVEHLKCLGLLWCCCANEAGDVGVPEIRSMRGRVQQCQRICLHDAALCDNRADLSVRSMLTVKCARG